MSGNNQGIFSQLTRLPSATADSDAQVGLGIRSSFTKPSLSRNVTYPSVAGNVARQFEQLRVDIVN